MKKTKVLSYIILLIFVVLISFSVYVSANSGSDKTIEEKVLAEVEYLESEIVELMNKMNNIEIYGYKVEIEQIPVEEQSAGTETDDSQPESNSEEERYEIVKNTILTNTEEIDWEGIKVQIESFYEVLPAITLDFYEVHTNTEDILNFNKKIDELTLSIKNENKEETLKILSDLYSYIPRFYASSSATQLKIELADMKRYVYEAYSILDSEKWSDINTLLDKAEEQYAGIISGIELGQGEKYKINKGYIILNELISSTELEDISVFLIKYRNLLEEINNV